MRYDAGEVITAMVTPFNEKREVDYEKVEILAHQLVNTGSDAVIVAGTTGESPTLTFDEEIEILSSVKRAVNNQGKVIMGAGSNCTQTAVMMSKRAEKEGADAILSVVPYYNKPSQSGLIEHFSEIAKSVSLPIILYNIPSRTGINMSAETVKTLARNFPDSDNRLIVMFFSGQAPSKNGLTATFPKQTILSNVIKGMVAFTLLSTTISTVSPFL